MTNIPEMKPFLAYLRCDTVEEGLGRQIEDAVQHVRQHEKWRDGYMNMKRI